MTLKKMKMSNYLMGGIRGGKRDVYDFMLLSNTSRLFCNRLKL